MERPDQLRRMRRRRILAVVAMIAMMAVAVFGGMSSPPSLQHQLQPAATAAPVVTVTADSCTTVDNIKLASVVLLEVPGTSSTVYNPPAQSPSLSWFDGGKYDQIPDQFVLLDKSKYPAVLGHGNEITDSNGNKIIVDGQQSIDMGATWLVDLINQHNSANTVFVIPTGSQGAMAGREALIKLAQQGYPMDHIFMVLYSDPYTQGTGIVDRFNSNQDALNTGVMGGSPSIPSGPTVIEVNHAYDPMSNAPRYLWTLPVTVLNAILGFAFEHGDLGLINYRDPNNTVEVNGNVTKITINPRTIPLLMPIVFGAYLAGVPVNVSQALLKPLDDILRPIVDMGGQRDPGKFTLLPTPEVFVHQLAAIASGFVKAAQSLGKLATGQSPFPADLSGPDPIQQLIDQANAKDKELNGIASTPVSGASTTVLATAATSPSPHEVSETVVETGQVTPQSRVTPSVAPSPKESADPTPQPQVAEKNGTDTKGKDDSAPIDSVTPSQPSPSIDQSKVTDVAPPKQADQGQHQSSQKDGDTGDAPKANVKPDKSGDTPKGDTKPVTRGQKNGDDSNTGKKDSGTTKPDTPADAPRRGTGMPSRQTTSGADGDEGKSASSDSSTRRQSSSKGDTDRSNSGSSGNGGSSSKPAHAAAHTAD